MKAIVITQPGSPEVLQLQEVEDPQIKDDEVLIKVEATALNRADTLQRKGSYPPPKGASPHPGLECSGTILSVGKNVSRWKVGDQVCALLGGGGYAEKVAVPAGQVLPVPSGVSLKDAAAFPEVACTVWSTVFMTSHLSPGESFLVHGGSSGIGTFAIQMGKCQGVRVFVTAGSEEKLAVCKDLGADVCINYKTEDFVARVKEETGGKAAGLRSRSTENKALIVSEVEKNVWPAIAVGKVKPVIYKYLPLCEAAEAHQLMESSQHIGKIMLVP
ncbi:quinone oxidoreductase PIG3-like isoform X2 [Citrus clementina]|uniref:quinone oxidoreductase PIG3-like isoform X2 n=1 Tax=Citrus clementina TaxID=85681 RepID=UPI000CED10F6|nr:quinone oxidoreductase PIG3-like isoform X2 [Citrus x clementina]